MDHQPVLVESFINFFSGRSLKFFVDGTLGAGGHARLILEAHPEIEKFYGFDRDPEALEIASQNLTNYKDKVSFIHSNFREMDQYLEKESVDGMFLDLGVSSMQLDRPEKGFSFNKEGPLDMRMDPSQRLDAKSVVNSFSEKKLGEIFRDFGEEPRWRRAAAAIVEARRKKRIETTLDLVEALKPVLTWGGMRGKKIHPMTLVFQALRIYVNDELQGIQEGLMKGLELLKPGGRFAVITFHSLEDRIVKNQFRNFAQEKRVLLLTKKPLEASLEEVKENPRSRSAKMRLIEKL